MLEGPRSKLPSLWSLAEHAACEPVPLHPNSHSTYRRNPMSTAWRS